MTVKKRKIPDAEEDYFSLGDDTPVDKGPGPGRGWPDEVPVLLSADMAWTFTTDSGRRDLLEWLDATFEDRKQHEKARKVLCRVVSDRFGHPVKCLWTFLEHTHEHHRPDLAWQAACWNQAMKELGYAIPVGKCEDTGK